MKLKEAWMKIKEMENSERFQPNQIYSILSDLGVFKTNPRIRLVLKSALHHNLWMSVLNPNVTTLDILSLKSKLDYDGFSKELIEEIFRSFYLSNNLECKNLPNDKPLCRDVDKSNNSEGGSMLYTSFNGELCFLGIPLGHQLSEFSSMMKSNFKYDKRWEGASMENYERYLGPFAHLKNCSILIYFDRETLNVYKIVVTSLNFEHIESEYKETMDLYSTKYGQPIFEVKTIRKSPIQKRSERNNFPLTDNEYIEIRYNENPSLQIKYCKSQLEIIVKDNIEKFKKKERHKREMEQLKIKIENLSKI